MKIYFLACLKTHNIQTKFVSWTSASLGVDTARTTDLKRSKRSHSICCHAQDIKAGGRKRKGGHVPSCGVLSFWVTSTCDGTLLYWEWLNIWLPTESGELTPCFALLMWAAFAFPLKFSLSQPTLRSEKLSYFYPSNSFPQWEQTRSEQVAA